MGWAGCAAAIVVALLVAAATYSPPPNRRFFTGSALFDIVITDAILALVVVGVTFVPLGGRFGGRLRGGQL